MMTWGRLPRADGVGYTWSPLAPPSHPSSPAVASTPAGPARGPASPPRRGTGRDRPAADAPPQGKRDDGDPRDDRRIAVRLLLLELLLATPTGLERVLPLGVLPDLGYLVGFALVVAVVFSAGRRSGEVRSWTLIALGLAVWFTGDLLDRVAPSVGYRFGGIGVTDVLWLAGYPLIAAGILHRVRRRGLAVGSLREVLLDSSALTVAAAVVAWVLIVLPQADPSLSPLAMVVNVAYPLGDLMLLAVACVLALAPDRSPVDLLLMVCLSATLVVDSGFTLLPALAPTVDVLPIDAVLLLVNTLFACAALVSLRHRDASPTARLPHMPVSRMVLLGSALTIGPAVGFLDANPTPTTRVLQLVASTVVAAIVLVRLFGVVRQREAAQQQAAHQARHDPLTGLANRSLLTETLQGLLARPEGHRELCVLFGDVDRFKHVNDTHGHTVGDQVLAEVADRIAGSVRQGELVARLGGDEFAVLLPGEVIGEAEVLARRLSERVAEPILVAGTRSHVGLSVGLARWRDVVALDGEDRLGDPGAWLQVADAAMYRHKRRPDRHLPARVG